MMVFEEILWKVRREMDRVWRMSCLVKVFIGCMILLFLWLEILLIFFCWVLLSIFKFLKFF